MYELPSEENVTKVVVDEAVVNGETKPYVIYESDEASRPAVVENQRPTGSTY
jgi:ATP-dependent Clp protease ATP-binding subunit ClpX